MTDQDALRERLESGTGFPSADYAWTRTPDADAWLRLNLIGEAGAVWGDDRQQDQALSGQVHLFTRRMGSADMRAVQAVLREQDFHWRLDGVAYESDTRLLHYTWVWNDWEED